jgi:hypothetical protein
MRSLRRTARISSGVGAHPKVFSRMSTLLHRQAPGGIAYYIVLIGIGSAAAGAVFCALRVYIAVRNGRWGRISQIGVLVVAFALAVAAGLVLVPTNSKIELDIFGVVRDEKGNPVAGATINVAGLWAGITDSSGYFKAVIAGDNLKTILDIDVAAPGFVPEHVKVVPVTNQGNRVAIVLKLATEKPMSGAQSPTPTLQQEQQPQQQFPTPTSQQEQQLPQPQSEMPSKPVFEQLSPNGRLRLTIFGDGTARLQELASDGYTAKPGGIRWPQGAISAAAFSPDNRWLGTGAEDGTVRLCDLTARDSAANPIVLRGLAVL